MSKEFEEFYNNAVKVAAELEVNTSPKEIYIMYQLYKIFKRIGIVKELIENKEEAK